MNDKALAIGSTDKTGMRVIKERIIFAGIVMSMLLQLAALGNNVGTKTGKEIFESNCTPCHGTDGTKGKWGAANLQRSRLTEKEMSNVIINGRRIMPAWGKKLSQEEIRAVITYVKMLRF